jgi:hypothetical protein
MQTPLSHSRYPYTSVTNKKASSAHHHPTHQPHLTTQNKTRKESDLVHVWTHTFPHPRDRPVSAFSLYFRCLSLSRIPFFRQRRRHSERRTPERDPEDHEEACSSKDHSEPLGGCSRAQESTPRARQAGPPGADRTVRETPKFLGHEGGPKAHALKNKGGRDGELCVHRSDTRD